MIACQNCHTELPDSFVNTGQLHQCPKCQAKIRVDLFNAFFKAPVPGQPADTIVQQGQAECFYHPGKTAVGACSSCGRLLCALCNVQWETSNMCMSCLQIGQRKRRITSLENDRVLYDNIALSVAVIPILSFWMLTFLTGPIAIYLSVRYWRTPLSILPRTRIRFILAIVVSGAQVAGWTLLLSKILG